MARSTTKELERLIKLREQGAISEREFLVLRQKAMSGVSAQSKKEDDTSNKDAFFGFLFILLCAGGYYLYNNMDSIIDKNEKPKTVQKLTDKQCTQIWKDEGYFISMRSVCANLINVGTGQDDFSLKFRDYAKKNKCPQTDSEAFEISRNTQITINEKISEANQAEGSLVAFCESQKNYFSKVLKKYDLN